jgi:DTW domain-containing protein
MRSRTPPTLEGHCRFCYLRLEYCICSELPRIDTKTEVIIIRHLVEARLTSNTGRLAALCLTNCRLLEYRGDTPFEASSIDPLSSVLLYPGTEAPLSFVPQRLIVIDATFRQARRMYQRIPILHQTPQLALLAPAVAPMRLRVPPHPDGMSTIEAIAYGLGIIEDPKLKLPLLDGYARFVERADRQRGRIRPEVPSFTDIAPEKHLGNGRNDD